jgi:HD-GYP domain-containing protein (c-di-GMP phosphodiesterase class II)
VLIQADETKPKSKYDSLAGQMKALAIVLCEEFGVKFTFYNTSTLEKMEVDFEADANSGERLRPEKVKQFAACRLAEVYANAGGGYQLVLPMGEPDAPCLLAVASLAGFARSESEEMQELRRLGKWARSVCDRINLTTGLPVQHRRAAEQDGAGAFAWETLVKLEQLMRRVRIHKESARHQKRILRAAADLLRVKAVVWLSHQADAKVLVGGESVLSAFELRQLAIRLYKSPDLEKTGMLVVNRLKDTNWGASFPQLHNLIALIVRDHGANGLLIAMNKSQDAGSASSVAPPVPLRRSDTLAFTSFGALFGLHTGASLRYRDLKDLLVGMTRSLTSAIDAKDAYTYGHSERVGRIAIELGRALNQSEDELNDLYLGGLMHDIGKIGIRDSVLTKKGALTPAETEHLRQHVTIGHAIVADLQPIRHLFPAILYHHERYDGAGYPEGLQGESIPMIARILAVADAYDAMTTTRPYRIAMTHDRAEEILGQGAGTQWDPQVVDAFFRCREKIFIIRQRGVGDSLRQAIDGALRGDDSSRQLPALSLLEPTNCSE